MSYGQTPHRKTGTGLSSSSPPQSSLSSDFNMEDFQIQDDENEVEQWFKENEETNVLDVIMIKNGKWNKYNAKVESVDVSKLKPWEIEKSIQAVQSTVAHLTVNAHDVGIENLFISDDNERIMQTIRFAMEKGKEGIKNSKPVINKGKEPTMTDATRALVREVMTLEKIIAQVKEFPKDKKLMDMLKGFKCIQYTQACLERANKKLCEIINVTYNYYPMNQLLTTGGDGEYLDTCEIGLGINNKAPFALNMLRKSGRAATTTEYRKLIKEWNENQINWNKMNTQYFITWYAERVNEYAALEEMAKTLLRQPGTKHLIQLPMFFENLTKWLGDPNNPTCTSRNYIANESTISSVTLEIENHYLDENGEELTAEMRCSIAKARILEMLDRGNFKTSTNSEKFSLNVNAKSTKPKFKAKIQWCGGVQRNGHCDRPGCKFKPMTKEEWDKRKPCKDRTTPGTHCKGGFGCPFKHPGDVFKLNEPCVHRDGGATVNNVNGGEKSDDGGAEDKDE